MDLGLARKVALVLGGSGGLGRATAVSLGREGACVAIAGRNEEALKRSQAAVERVGGTALTVIFDLKKIDKINDCVSEVEARLGHVDILVNNTGGPPPTPACGQDPDVWRKQFEAMVLSVITLTDRVLPQMRTRGWGRVITSTSSGAVSPLPNLGISNTLRASLLGWSKSLAREVANDGITANVVVPGRVATDRLTFLDKDAAMREGLNIDDIVTENIAAIPVGRYGRPEEYGDVIAFLASERASYITGSIIRIDGGLIASI